MYIPELVPFNFIKDENIDYRTIFPNAKNTQPTQRTMFPRWQQVVPIDTEIIFYVWTTAGGVVVGSDLDADIIITEQATSSNNRLWKISITFNELGENELTLVGDGETYISNLFEVLDDLQDEIDEYIFIEYSNFENDFDYWFNDGLNYFPLWCKIIDKAPVDMADVETYEGEENKSEVTRAYPNKGVEIITPALDDWFALLLVNVFVCSLIKVNGILYSPESSASIDRLEEGVYQSIVEITLQNK